MVQRVPRDAVDLPGEGYTDAAYLQVEWLDGSIWLCAEIMADALRDDFPLIARNRAVLGVLLVCDRRDGALLGRILPLCSKDDLAKRGGCRGVEVLAGPKVRLHGLRFGEQ